MGINIDNMIIEKVTRNKQDPDHFFVKNKDLPPFFVLSSLAKKGISLDKGVLMSDVKGQEHLEGQETITL